MKPVDIRMSWREEKQSAYLYTILATREQVPRFARLFQGLAKAAEEQAHYWERAAGERAVKLPAPYKPSMRARLVGQLLKRLGPRPMLPVLAAMKIRGLSIYTQPQRSHHGHPPPTAAGETERRHIGVTGGGNLRAAILGVNDGLISNASLIFGVAGAALQNRIIFLTGLAGLLAGALSMGAGEYLSMRSQREMFEYQIKLEQEELEEYPREEAMELALIYEARGLEPNDARRMADEIIADPERALDTLAREELGLDPGALGSPWGAAFASFFAFAIGAIVPLAPFIGANPAYPLIATVSVTAAALFLVGMAASLFTGRSAWLSALRMLIIGAIAGTSTYAIGHAFGVSGI